MPVNGFDGHEQRKAYRNHHMPACATISGRHARKIRPPQVQPLQPAPRSEHTFFRRLIMTYNNKLARAKSYANTQRSHACASFLDTANTCANTQKSHAVSAILAHANVEPNTHRHVACASFFGMAVSTTDALHMVAMPTILAAAKAEPNTHRCSAAAPTLGLHRRPSEYPPRRRVGHHKSCGNTNMTANAHTSTVFPHSFLG